MNQLFDRRKIGGCPSCGKRKQPNPQLKNLFNPMNSKVNRLQGGVVTNKSIIIKKKIK